MHMGHVRIHANNSVKYVKHYIVVVVGPISTTLFHICIYTQCVCVHTRVCAQCVCKYTCPFRCMQRSEADIKYLLSLSPYFFETKSLVDPGVLSFYLDCLSASLQELPGHLLQS